MNLLRSWVFLFLFVLTPLFFSVPALASVSFEIFLPDRSAELLLDRNEHFYLGISYDSDLPVRFQPRGLRLSQKREVGARTSASGLHASGKGKALTWIAFDNPTHIDEVIVDAYDEEWTLLATASISINTYWSDVVVETPREPAAWVEVLQKKERTKSDYLFDAEPKQPKVVSDTIFILALLSIPVYLFLQIYMLRRYRLRWRELATVPIITALPLTVYAFWVGIGFNLRQWPPFLMYFSLAACGFLLTLWVMKKIKE